MSPGLVARLAAALKEPLPASEMAVRGLLLGVPSPPPLADVLELGARARQQSATEETLKLALATLLALHAPPAEPPGPEA